MEKKVPHYSLAIAKALVVEGKVRTTFSARQGALELGMDETGICEVLAALVSTDFYKSMTTHANHRVWQDVYRPATFAGDVYVKSTVIDDLLVISFKEL